MVISSPTLPGVGLNSARHASPRPNSGAETPVNCRIQQQTPPQQPSQATEQRPQVWRLASVGCLPVENHPASTVAAAVASLEHNQGEVPLVTPRMPPRGVDPQRQRAKSPVPAIANAKWLLVASGDQNGPTPTPSSSTAVGSSSAASSAATASSATVPVTASPSGAQSPRRATSPLAAAFVVPVQPPPLGGMVMTDQGGRMSPLRRHDSPVHTRGLQQVHSPMVDRSCRMDSPLRTRTQGLLHVHVGGLQNSRSGPLLPAAPSLVAEAQQRRASPPRMMPERRVSCAHNSASYTSLAAAAATAVAGVPLRQGAVAPMQSPPRTLRGGASPQQPTRLLAASSVVGLGGVAPRS